MIQHGKFNDGSYVLHKVMLNGHKYSAWYGKDGVLYSAERIKGEFGYNVPKKYVNVWAELTKIGARYINV